MHLNVCDATGYNADVHETLEPWVYEAVAAAGGSISAEHGVGQCKPDHLHLNKPAAAIDLMAAIKRTLDPNLILNPYFLRADPPQTGRGDAAAAARIFS